METIISVAIGAVAGFVFFLIAIFLIDKGGKNDKRNS